MPNTLDEARRVEFAALADIHDRSGMLSGIVLKYFVCPNGIIQPDELPPDIGLKWVAKTGTRLFTKRKAQRREIELPADLLVSGRIGCAQKMRSAPWATRCAAASARSTTGWRRRTGACGSGWRAMTPSGPFLTDTTRLVTSQHKVTTMQNYKVKTFS